MSRPSKSGMTPALFTQLYMESWKAGHSVRQFAERIKTTVGRVHSRVQYYRKKGAALPDLRRVPPGGSSGNALPVADMNAIISRAMEYRGTVPDAVRPAPSNGRLVGNVS
jgi:hypothetical protein